MRGAAGQISWRLTWNTLTRGILRCLPLEERHMRCASASASRKKCILGLPSRPCFSRSVPCNYPQNVYQHLGSQWVCCAAPCLQGSPQDRVTAALHD